MRHYTRSTPPPPDTKGGAGAAQYVPSAMSGAWPGLVDRGQVLGGAAWGGGVWHGTAWDAVMAALHRHNACVGARDHSNGPNPDATATLFAGRHGVPKKQAPCPTLPLDGRPNARALLTTAAFCPPPPPTSPEGVDRRHVTPRPQSVGGGRGAMPPGNDAGTVPRTA